MKEGFQERVRRQTRERVARHRARRKVEGEPATLTEPVHVVASVSPAHVVALAGHHPSCKCLLCGAARG
jgi:hypothetical protein